MANGNGSLGDSKLNGHGHAKIDSGVGLSAAPVGKVQPPATIMEQGQDGKPQKPYPYNTDPEPGNPTVMPTEIWSQFHFAFLIRDPHFSVPSYYRCTIPPLDDVTGFYNYDPSEAGYDEVRRTLTTCGASDWSGLTSPRTTTRAAPGARAMVALSPSSQVSARAVSRARKSASSTQTK